MTSLEMLKRPECLAQRRFPPGFSLVSLGQPSLDRYRALYREVGEDWLWYSRLVMPDDGLRAILDDPRVEFFALQDGRRDVGILELDFREPNTCELAFFGLAGDAIGKGVGRTLMNEAIKRAWSRPIERFWVHTCTLDHPAALGFYVRSGFTPCGFQVEVDVDPRLTGVIPRHCAPHVPLID
ncbi:GNAT family N-acetyltransferase [Mesorhizobium sp. BAC0120]|nr:GNAT family N-acetyltransferase [Mesorhizobium sp. BAC0120]MDW6025622.1 GNAT family N-acetyltransferase [Mesorhizobium sp. BAC0120]